MRRLHLAVAAGLVSLTACSGSSSPHVAPSRATLPPSQSLSQSSSLNSNRLPDWPGYHGGGSDTGLSPAPALTGPMRIAWRLRVDAALYAQPIVADNRVVVATERNTVYAVDPSNGHVSWKRNLVAPARRGDLPCGNIDPSGITGTPAYDPTTRLVYVVTESSSVTHALWALDIGSGRVAWKRSLDVFSNRDRHAEQERAAILVNAGRVYVAFGGRYGDCGNYVGYVVAIRTDGTGPTLRYAIPTTSRAGMWAAGGPVVGPGGDVYVASGNGAETGGRYDGSDSVVRLSPMLRQLGLFAPSSWAADNAQDLDLGSMSPTVVGNHVVIAGKRGTTYLLDTGLGGVGGQVTEIGGCAGYGGGAVIASSVVMPCDAGIRLLDVGNARLHWRWGPVPGLGSAALATGVVYALDRNNGNLVELSLATGHRRASIHVGTVTRFATPSPVGPYVFVGTTTSLVAVTGAA